MQNGQHIQASIWTFNDSTVRQMSRLVHSAKLRFITRRMSCEMCVKTYRIVGSSTNVSTELDDIRRRAHFLRKVNSQLPKRLKHKTFG